MIVSASLVAGAVIFASGLLCWGLLRWVKSFGEYAASNRMVAEATLEHAKALQTSTAFLGALLVLLVICGLAALWLQPSGPDLFLHGVAWLLAAGIASEEAPQPLRRSLTVYFGWGALAWLCYVLEPGWTSWLAYQGTRLVGICLFGYACLRPAPRLRVI